MVEKQAEENLRKLSGNPYPGRGFVIGRTPDNQNDVQVYWLMGRSESSRNRRLVRDKHIVRTEAVDPSKVKDPSLIIYNAMREDVGLYVVTNGDQTDTVFESRENASDTFQLAMRRREFEPDAPHYTPRISAMCRSYDFRIAVLSRSSDGRCERATYEYTDLPPGYGYCVHTYRSDGNPLPAFIDRPYMVPIGGALIEEVSHFFWGALSQENRVALVTKFIDTSTGTTKVHIINRF